MASSKGLGKDYEQELEELKVKRESSDESLLPMDPATFLAACGERSLGKMIYGLYPESAYYMMDGTLAGMRCCNAGHRIDIERELALVL